jgi:hypothetical protein
MWVTEAREFETVQLRFAQRISEALSTVLARLRSEAPKLANSVTTRLSRASEDTIGRVLLSPSVSQLLLWKGGSAVEIGRFLESCLLMEAVARESNTQNARSIWGALGDCVLRDTGELVRWDPIGGRLPVDFESPDVIALGATHPAEALGWKPLTREEQRTLLETLTTAYLRVQSGGTSLRALTEISAKVVVIRKRPTKLFCSFSSCYYVGRIALVNPQLVNESLIAEALVHEAIHAYLYMHEPRPLWGLTPDVHNEPGSVHSPWTGRALPVSTFLHACFVWYGLFFFWGQMMGSSHSPVDEVRRGIERASSGFIRGPLLDQLEPERIGFVRDEVQAAIAEMQNNVLAVVA